MEKPCCQNSSRWLETTGLLWGMQEFSGLANLYKKMNGGKPRIHMHLASVSGICIGRPPNAVQWLMVAEMWSISSTNVSPLLEILTMVIQETTI